MNPLNYVFDIAFVVVVLLTAVVVARRMLVESALLLLAILLASLTAMTTFEPIGEFCSRRMFLPSDIGLTRYLWFLAAAVVFLATFAGLFKIFFSAFERPPQFNRGWEVLGCWALGLVAGYVLAAFLLTLVHTLPFSRNFGGMFEPDARQRTGPIMALAPDYQFIWLAESVSNPEGLQPREWPVATPGKATTATASVSRKRLAWFPIRYANWREKLAAFDSAEDLEATEQEAAEQEAAERDAAEEEAAEEEAAEVAT